MPIQRNGSSKSLSDLCKVINYLVNGKFLYTPPFFFKIHHSCLLLPSLFAKHKFARLRIKLKKKSIDTRFVIGPVLFLPFLF